MLNKYQIELIWIPGHHNIGDNEKAKECGVIVESLDETMVYNDVLTPFIVMHNKTGHLGKLQPDDLKVTTQILLSFVRYR